MWCLTSLMKVVKVFSPILAYSLEFEHHSNIRVAFVDQKFLLQVENHAFIM